jgi:hypothetical protein
MSKRVEINVEKARALKAQGWGYTRIGELLGTTGQTVKTRLEPDYEELRKQRTNEIRRSHRGYSIKDVVLSERRVPEEILAARLAEIPQDTRTQGQRLLGDPLPGRSALDRRTVR